MRDLAKRKFLQEEQVQIYQVSMKLKGQILLGAAL
jgi:hypothetical protein